MADKKNKPAAPAKTRTVLSPAQRLEKMRAELAAAEVKATEQSKKVAAKIDADIAKLEGKRDDLNTKITVLQSKRAQLVGVDETPADESTAG